MVRYRQPYQGGLSTESANWRDDANCLTSDPALFFPEGAKNTMAYSEQVIAAKRVCAGCKVAKQCLQYALEYNQNDGIWGGLTEDERTALKRRNARLGVQAVISS